MDKGTKEIMTTDRLTEFKNARGYFPSEGTIEFAGYAQVEYTQNFQDDTVMLTVNDMIFDAKGIKQLRKWLKIVLSEMTPPVPEAP